MRNKSFGLFLGVVLVALLSGCAVPVTKPAEPIKKVAIVSFIVSDWRGSVLGSINTSGRWAGGQKLIDQNLESMLAETENGLARFMKVTRVSGFISNPEYRSFGVQNVNDHIDRITTPVINGQTMAVFSQKNKDVIGGVLKQDVAKKLCADLHVDGVVLVYSEWTTQRGHFVPLEKALTKNVFTVWDKHGALVFKKRVDQMGQRTLGAGGFTMVNSGTIVEWVTSYDEAMDTILADMKTLTL